MKKLVLILLASFIVFSAGATILKNGAEADQKRIDQVWKAIKKIKDYPLLLCTAMDCKDGKTSECVTDWDCDQQIIAEWIRLNIIKNDILDKETQEIIITSYFGDREPVWGVEASKKIALATPSYPVDSWVEKIPGYGLFKAVKRIKTICSTVVHVPPYRNR